MSTTENAIELQAVTRLFELASVGETHSNEFKQLESMVYARLMQCYAGIGKAAATGVHVLGVQKSYKPQ